MQFHRPLLNGILLKRYKRFFADIEYDGQVILAHVPNSGSMRGCNTPGMPCRFSFDDNPKRKLKYTLEMVQVDGNSQAPTWVGVNTSIPNKIVQEAFEKKTIFHWSQFNRFQREVAINDKSRLDLALWSDSSHDEEKLEFKKIDLKTSKQKFHFVEVKNVSLAENKVALFPDSVTERGQKHLTELMKLMDWGHTTEILFTIQRNDTQNFSSADHIDVEYGNLLREAEKKGVKVTPVLCSLSETEVFLTDTDSQRSTVQNLTI